MVLRATMESKTEGTIWKSIKNCLRNRCQKWPCILFRANHRENKKWGVQHLMQIKRFHKKISPVKLLITKIIHFSAGAISPMWTKKVRHAITFGCHPREASAAQAMSIATKRIHLPFSFFWRILASSWSRRIGWKNVYTRSLCAIDSGKLNKASRNVLISCFLLSATSLISFRPNCIPFGRL